MRRQDVNEILRLAGWHEGRQVLDAVSRWETEMAEKGGFVMNDAARSFLAEFGALAWPTRQSGEHLPSYSFNIDPTAAVFEKDRFDDAAEKAGEALFPLGEVINGHYFLAAGASGKIYLVMDDLQVSGDDPWAAFEQLLAGR